MKDQELQNILQLYKLAWPKAIGFWSKYTKIQEPQWCVSIAEEKKEALHDSFAMIRLTDHRIVISIRQIQALQLHEFALPILAHELGHHVYCPGDLNDHAKMLARVRLALDMQKNKAPYIANLYSDLLINYKLQRDFGLDIAGVYRKIKINNPDKLWILYMRIYEILFSLTTGSLSGKKDASVEADAQLGNRLIRNYGIDWLKGAGRFAALCLPYLLQAEDKKSMKAIAVWNDTRDAGKGSECPDGLVEFDPSEENDCRHPALDSLEDTNIDRRGLANNKKQAAENTGNQGQCREPFEYGEILRAMGITLSRDEMTTRYYKERAIPYLIPFPSIETPISSDPLPEGLDVWDISSPIEHINWFESIIRSPIVIPGYTTLEQVYGNTQGTAPEKQPIDLDIYIDCSGSMPDPSHSISYLALAGTIICLSALRTGAKVQATLWSGKKQFQTTGGFIRDETEILKIVTGYIGGATAFPIHIMRDTYETRKASDRKVHILQISDDGITTMFDKDENNNSGRVIAENSLKTAGGGGTFVLNLWSSNWQQNQDLVTASKMGWEISVIQDWQDLVKFAKEFSKRKYGEKK
ncbi:MAG: VWA domain-containing protein [Spirochaetota bacterium]